MKFVDLRTKALMKNMTRITIFSVKLLSNVSKTVYFFNCLIDISAPPLEAGTAGSKRQQLITIMTSVFSKTHSAAQSLNDKDTKTIIFLLGAWR
jgi:hypothetical protein